MAIDLPGMNPLTYRAIRSVTLSKSVGTRHSRKSFLRKAGLPITEYYLDLDPGDYYWRVIIKDAKGNTQRAFDDLVVDDQRYFGLKEITID